jgi:ribonuclease HI
VETYGLLPTNHFGARKQRSAEQALMVLQEYIYVAWRRHHVVSLVSFDVKAAYNGVYKQRLLQRLRARGIPDDLVRWIEGFCSNRTATIQVNGQSSETQSLPQAGLPQGSPLSPILYLFFNADLVQRQIDANGGAIAFIDDFTAWVASPTVELNRNRLQAIIDSALDWEQRSGATFEADKTAIIHFTRNAKKLTNEPFTIKGRDVYPKDHVKILGLVMDTRLKYKQHIARAASKGLGAALELTRLKGLSTATARQLFSATVAPVVDYASNIWMHEYRYRNMAPINRVQRVGAQAIVGTFLTVATSIAETEASIPTANERFWKRAIKLWVDIHTLPKTNPLRRIASRVQKFYKSARSPFHQVACRLKDVPLQELESIQPFALKPWEKRIQAFNYETVATQQDIEWDIRVAVSCSARNGVVGVGGVVRDTPFIDGDAASEEFSFTLGFRTEQNPYSGELAAMAHALNILPNVSHRRIALLTTNRAVALSLRNPQQQSGQSYVRSVYKGIDKLWKNKNGVLVFWIPSSDQNDLLQLAKRAARKATKEGAIPEKRFPSMKSTTLNIERKKIIGERSLPDRVGKYSKRVDAALPGQHTRQLYDNRPWIERNALAQMRTDMTRLNNSLYRIHATPSRLCACGREPETVAHFLFRCTQWEEHRTKMHQCTQTNRGNLSFFLGGKSLSDGPDWQPSLKAVQATICFALATGRLQNKQHN